MSFLKVFCAVKSRGGVLNIAGLGHATINLLGCSACASLAPKEQANSFLVTDCHEGGDLLAITLTSGNSTMPYLIEIEKKDDFPYINLNKPESNETWVPKPDRMIQLFKNGFMRIKIDDEWFSTDQSDHEKGHRILPVSAGNLMVKYAYGLAEAKEIIDLAEEIQLQADAVELLEIQAEKNALLNRQLREQENQIHMLTNNLNRVLFSTGTTINRMSEIERNVNDINSELGKIFPGKKSIRQSLSNISTIVTEVNTVLTK